MKTTLEFDLTNKSDVSAYNAYFRSEKMFLSMVDAKNAIEMFLKEIEKNKDVHHVYGQAYYVLSQVLKPINTELDAINNSGLKHTLETIGEKTLANNY